MAKKFKNILHMIMNNGEKSLIFCI